MIDLKNTDWIIKSDLTELDRKTFSIVDENKLLFDNTIEGTINIKDDTINIDITNYHFSGHIVEGFIFGDIIHNKQNYNFECNCIKFDPANVYMSECKGLNFGDNEEEIKSIQHIYDIIKDYRIEYSDGSRISKSRIKKWINQFEESVRIPILTELANIFNKRYLSKKRVLSFFDDVIIKLARSFNFENIIEFLAHCQFLSLQEKGKSQTVMLSLLDEYFTEKYEFALSQCGTKSKKYSIYLDDVFCTGSTFYNNLIDWLDEPYDKSKTNSKAIVDGTTILRGAYVFLHEKNFQKKANQISFKHKIGTLTIWGKLIDNFDKDDSKFEILQPLMGCDDTEIRNYKEEIIKEVDNHCQTKGYKSPKEEFYRPNGKPKDETLFTTPNNRAIMENTFLKKGIEILNNSSSTIKNMRTLGYSLPSHKNFGFGALCFTWRNIPNNTPLVFWYSGGGFTPLFDVRKSNSSALIDFANFVIE